MDCMDYVQIVLLERGSKLVIVILANAKKKIISLCGFLNLESTYLILFSISVLIDCEILKPTWESIGILEVSYIVVKFLMTPIEISTGHGCWLRNHRCCRSHIQLVKMKYLTWNNDWIIYSFFEWKQLY